MGLWQFGEWYLQRSYKLPYPTAVYWKRACFQHLHCRDSAVDCSVLFYSTTLPIVLSATYVRVAHCGELQRAFYSTIIVGR